MVADLGTRPTRPTIRRRDPRPWIAAPRRRALDAVLHARVWLVAGDLLLAVVLLNGFPLLKWTPNLVILVTAILMIPLIGFAPRGTLRSTRISLLFLVYTTWSLLSVLWASSVGGWLGQMKLLMVPVIVLPVLAAMIPTSRLLQSWRWISYGTVVWNLVLTALSPSQTTQNFNFVTGEVFQSGWRGGFDHKNNFAFFMLLTMILALATESRPWLRRTVVVATTALVLLSESATGINCLVAVGLVYALIRYRQRYRERASQAFVFACVIGISLVLVLTTWLLPTILELYGKDVTLSGRTDIWRESMKAARAEWLLGYTPGNIWYNQGQPPTAEITRNLGYVIFHAHNGALEIVLQLGVVGLAIVLLLMANSIRQGAQLIDSHRALSMVTLLLAAIMLVGSVTEVPIIGVWMGLMVMLQVVCLRELGTRDRLNPSLRALAEWRQRRMLSLRR